MQMASSPSIVSRTLASLVFACLTTLKSSSLTARNAIAASSYSDGSTSVRSSRLTWRPNSLHRLGLPPQRRHEAVLLQDAGIEVLGQVSRRVQRVVDEPRDVRDRLLHVLVRSLAREPRQVQVRRDERLLDVVVEDVAEARLLAGLGAGELLDERTELGRVRLGLGTPLLEDGVQDFSRISDSFSGLMSSVSPIARAVPPARLSIVFPIVRSHRSLPSGRDTLYATSTGSPMLVMCRPPW
jgi:hypothetical protein